jgi:hydrogenase expression/formation protein HypE
MFSKNIHNIPPDIRAVLFDFDGTLTRPGALDFTVIRKALGCPPEQPVLEFIDAIPDPDRRALCHEELDRFEAAAAADSHPNEGAEDLIRYLREKDLKVGILSRNSRMAIDAAMENFTAVGPADFDAIISRDDDPPPKPDPGGILMAARDFGVRPSEILMVGDFVFDIEAGRNAGSPTVFLDNGTPAGASEIEADFTISRLDDLKSIIRLATPLPAGKFPNELLKEFLDDAQFADPSVIINPGIGEDIAAVDVSGEEVLILKSDPITFATDAIGHYAVLINANDIATSGAAPRWLLTTLLFPCGTTASRIFQALYDLKTVCDQWGITLCGGHTEITDAVCRPVISCALAGSVSRADLVDKKRMRPGDQMLLTKGLAVEGASIIAREFGEQLFRLGMTEAEIETCKGFLSDISILGEARIAAKIPGASAMHDVTEGGLGTALEELSIAGGHKIRVRMEDIPVFPETEKIGKLLDINPLGLIGSGSLLICCREPDCEELVNRVRAEGIAVTPIGEVVEGEPGVEAVRDGAPAEWPKFEVDEITRLF